MSISPGSIILAATLGMAATGTAFAQAGTGQDDSAQDAGQNTAENSAENSAQYIADSDAAGNEIFIDRTPLSCISMSRIETTQVIDDSTILFLGRGDRAFVNILDDDCPTLKQNGLFRYRLNSGIRTARLCDSQAITVIDRQTDSPTYNCGLGEFHRLTEDQVVMLRDPMAVHSIKFVPIDVPRENEANED